jgi:hypothetical protein
MDAPGFLDDNKRFRSLPCTHGTDFRANTLMASDADIQHPEKRAPKQRSSRDLHRGKRSWQGWAIAAALC